MFLLALVSSLILLNRYLMSNAETLISLQQVDAKVHIYCFTVLFKGLDHSPVDEQVLNEQFLNIDIPATGRCKSPYLLFHCSV